MPKRILIFTLTYFPFVGGAEVALKEITDRLDPKKYTFDLITLRFDKALPEVETKGNLTIYRIGFTAHTPTMRDLSMPPLVFNKYFFPFLAFWKASHMHRRKPYDAVWSMMANYAGFATFFFKWLYPGVPMLLTLQEGDPIEHIKHRVRFVYPVFRQIFTRANVVQAISNYLAEFARSMGAQGKIVVVPNGVPLADFAKEYSAEDRAALRDELRIPKNAHLLITTSRLVPKNAVDDVIRALPSLTNTYFLILGTGPDEWSLKLLAHELGVAERVIFAGHIAHEKIPLYLQSSDVFIRPSVSEGMGNSFIEAMAAGVPVIATPVGGIVDFLFDPDMHPDKPATGLFCDVHAPDSIVKQVKRLFADASVRTTLVENGRKLVRASYDWQDIAASMDKAVFAKL